MEINGQHVVITGANRGIGRAVAVMFAENKAHLHLANRTIDPHLAAELEKAGALSVEQIKVDLSSHAEIDAFLEKMKSVEVSIVFNNSGQLTGGLLEEQKLSDIDSMLQVNLHALIRITHFFLPGMLKRKKGKIINQSSVVGFMHFPCASTYSASKAAVAAFSECLRAELAGTGVSMLLLVTPGVETRMYDDIAKKYGKNLDLSYLRKISPMKYAAMVREAILEDLGTLKPGGLTGIGLKLARYAPRAFQKIAAHGFKRT